ncbi:hypothetical protein GCM10018954_028890 [Kutzneria kofuensis]
MLRTDVAGNPTFRDLLSRVRDVDLAAFANQDVPFELVVERVNPARSLAHHPLFQVMVILQGTDAGSVEMPGLAGTVEDLDTGVAKFDLSFNLRESADGIECSLEYATDLFDPATADALLSRLITVLRAVATEPSTPVGAVEVLTPRRTAPRPGRVECLRRGRPPAHRAGTLHPPGRGNPERSRLVLRRG